MLGKLLATPVNLLLLDEPSNHLDMESCDALVAAVDNFDGAVIMVTHNEMFLHALAQRLIVFEQDRVTVFEGTYQEFLDKGGWGDEASSASPTKSLNTSKAVAAQVSKKELRQQRSAIIGERSQRLKPINQAIEKTESTIEIKETRLGTLNQEMVQASQDQDGQRIAELSPAIRQCQEAIDALFSELETLYTDKEKVEAETDAQLKTLDV
jgi:ATP-binding cassette subfamily F protein 3